MFDVIPRWALALGIGTISAPGVATIAMEGLGTSEPVCAETHNGIDSSACVNGADKEGALASIDQLKAQLNLPVAGTVPVVE